MADSAALRAKMKEFFGYDAFKGGQEEIVHHLIDGGDAFVLMPTGGGKSLCYQLPALLMEGIVDDLPAPLGPASAVVFPLRVFSSSSKPSPVLALMSLASYPAFL